LKGEQSVQLTELESKVMKVVWDLAGKATVNEILEKWEDPKVPKYTTVLKILQILEEKEVVRHRKKGKAYVYVARMSRNDSLRHNLKKVIKDFFGGNRVLLANSLISDTEFTPDELEKLKRAIAEKEKGMGHE
jgi:BlaI family transcriptional regulator, penicillinase repressor